jgi:hypothetical protein
MPNDMPSGLTIFAIGFCLMLAFVLLLWAINVLPGKIMSSVRGRRTQDRSVAVDNSLATTSQQNNNNGIATSQPDDNVLLQVRAADLAKMVHAGKIGETEGIRLIFGCAPSSSNPKYITARAALKVELDKLVNPYPHRTTEQEQLRRELGLSKR